MSQMGRFEQRTLSRRLGSEFGQALADGIADGLSQALAGLPAVTEALSARVLELLREDGFQQAAAWRARVASETHEAEETARREADMLAATRCQHAGCHRRGSVEGFCRAHHAQHQRAMQGGLVRRRRSSEELAAVRSSPIPVSAVAPIIRRKNRPVDAPEPAPVDASPMAALTPDAVARWLGVKG